MVMKTANIACSVIGTIFVSLAMAAHSAETMRFNQDPDAYNRSDASAVERMLISLSDGGRLQALHRLGLKYENGEGVPQDDAQALKLYRQAADLGYAPAQFSLGLMHMTGKETVPQDHAEMLKWWLMAAHSGDTDAQLHLGLVYAWGEGVRRDDVTAYMWFSLAAARGARIAIKPRNNIANRMTFEQVARARDLVRAWRRTL